MRGWIPAGLVCGMLLVSTPMAGVARAAQQQQGTGQRGNRTPPVTAPYPTGAPLSTLDTPLETGPDPATVLQEHRRQLAMMSDRQKRIVEDTAKLLKLAGELKDDVDKTSKDTMSLDVIRKAEEIEKLAHDVKNRMKG